MSMIVCAKVFPTTQPTTSGEVKNSINLKIIIGPVCSNQK